MHVDVGGLTPGSIAVHATEIYQEGLRLPLLKLYEAGRENETVMLDSGTTTAEVTRHIKFLKLKSLTVITNALNIAMELANLPHVRVIMIGGILRHMSYSLVGPHAEQTLRGLNADRLFLGVDGLDPEIGLSTPDVLEAQLNAMMIRVSREVIVVADSSKFERRSLSVIFAASLIGLTHVSIQRSSRKPVVCTTSVSPSQCTVEYPFHAGLGTVGCGRPSMKICRYMALTS